MAPLRHAVRLLCAVSLLVVLRASPPAVVLWHGMGDTCCDGLLAVKERIQAVMPGAHVHSVMLGSTLDQDERQGFFGLVDEQLDSICSCLSSDANLTDGFHAVGFSQGGLLLRGLVQRCPGVKVHTLVTMGSPHGGVVEVPGCPATANGLYCGQMRRLLDAGAYNKLIRGSVVQAQYFRDAKKLDLYLEHSAFLADVNNEREEKNEAYAQRLASLKKLVMVRFSNDTTVVPRDSAWFSMQNGDDLIPLRSSQLYSEDWLGLRQLDNEGALVMSEAPGVHMQFSLQWFEDKVIRPYLTEPITAAAAVTLEMLGPDAKSAAAVA